jgi:hypothetical protein
MAAMTEQDKLRTLLPHWVKHNAEHTAEFRLWAELAGEAKADIEAAAVLMEAANEVLVQALDKLGGSMGNHDHRHRHDC